MRNPFNFEAEPFELDTKFDRYDHKGQLYEGMNFDHSYESFNGFEMENLEDFEGQWKELDEPQPGQGVGAGVNAPQAVNGWINLDQPADVFPGMVPKESSRVDNTRIGRPPASQVARCNPKSKDLRVPIYSTLQPPFRWICKLQVVATDAAGNRSYSEGSGLLIGDKYVLTAAHMLMYEVADPDGKVARVDARVIVVIPGLNGSCTKPECNMPFGWTSGTSIRTYVGFRQAFLRGKVATGPGALDFGLIELAEPIGARKFKALGSRPLGYWGSKSHGSQTVIRPVKQGILNKVRVNIVGYPTDKCKDKPRTGSASDAVLTACTTSDWASMQWVSFDLITDAGESASPFQVMEVAHHLAPGNSGGPVWIRWEERHNLIGITHSCELGGNAQAVRITNDLLKVIESWMKE